MGGWWRSSSGLQSNAKPAYSTMSLQSGGIQPGVNVVTSSSFSSSQMLTGSDGQEQLRVLLGKNWVLAKRSWRSTMGQLVTPLIIVSLLLGFQRLSDDVLTNDLPFPTPTQISTVPKCVAGAHPCTTVMFAPAPTSVPWVQELMANFSSMNNLVFGVDVVALPGASVNPTSGSWCMDNSTLPSPCGAGPPDPVCLGIWSQQGRSILPCAYFQDSEALQDYLLSHPNGTQNGVVIKSAYLNPQDLGISPDLFTAVPVGYSLFYNSTVSAFPFNWNDHSLEVKLSLDSIIAARRVGHTVSMSSSWSLFPRPLPRFVGFSVVAMFGGTYFYLPPMIVFFYTLTEVVTEKEERLRLGMRMIGLTNFSYWTSWYMTSPHHTCTAQKPPFVT